MISTQKVFRSYSPKQANVLVITDLLINRPPSEQLWLTMENLVQ